MEYFLHNIAEFIQVLRLSGVRISVSEAIDAVDALSFINLWDRQTVYLSLSACLAKSEDDRRIFKETFERFFVPMDIKRKSFEENSKRAVEQKNEIEKEALDLKFKDVPLDLSQEHKLTYLKLPAEQKESIVKYLEKASSGKNVRDDLRPLVEKIVTGRLDKYKQEFYQFIPATSMLQAGSSQSDFIAAEVEDSIRDKNNLLYKNFADIPEEDIPAMIQMIRALSEKMYRQFNRKKTPIGKKSILDLKRTLRCNMSTGHVLFKLKYKTRSRKRSPFVMMCDVSASMTRFSSFVLQFVMGMSNSISSLDTYIFSQTVEPLNLMNLKNSEDFDKVIKQSAIWHKGTNIGQSIFQILEGQASKLHSSTIVIIVSDAKTLEVDKLLKNLKKLKEKVKAILWFNPVPAREWDKIPGIAEIHNYCRMVECSNLSMLARACTSIRLYDNSR